MVDVGCGPGTDLASFAEAAGPTGNVIGIDADPDAITQAAPLALSHPWIDLRVGDIHSIDLPDGSADRFHADRVLQHVVDPAVVLAEARRVLRPGGRAVFAEPDYDTLVIDYPDAEVARTYRTCITERVVRNACVGRQLGRLSERAGFTCTRIVPITTVFRDASVADEILGLHRVTDRAITAGYLDADTAATWLDYVATESFFASATPFIATTEISGEQQSRTAEHPVLSRSLEPSRHARLDDGCGIAQGEWFANWRPPTRRAAVACVQRRFTPGW